MRYSLLILAFASACDHHDAHIPAEGPPAIAGGTLLVTHDGSLAVASDPDRASIFVADLNARQELHRIVLAAHDQPGRLVEDAAGHVHVVLREAGDLLTINPRTGDVLDRRALCAAPRGIAVDGSELVVACAEGTLLRLPAAGGAVTERLFIAPDLRDVVVWPDGRMLVSRFRSADVLVVEGNSVSHIWQAPQADGTAFDATTGTSTPTHHMPRVAWRLIGVPGGALMVHHLQQSNLLGAGGFGPGTPAYYGSADCASGILRTTVTMFQQSGDPATGAPRSGQLTATSLGVDVAMADGSQTIFVAAAAENAGGTASRTSSGFGVPASSSFNGLRRIGLNELSDLAPGCAMDSTFTVAQNVAIVAVAATPNGTVVAQQRDPAALVLSNGGTIPLSGGSIEDLGSSLFHEAPSSGMTCAGCHPEAGDDGHVWVFNNGDDVPTPRRTQTLTGGILSTAPFHHAGDIPDIGQVMQRTFVMKMGGTEPRTDEIAALGRWMNVIPALPGVANDAAAQARGEALFTRADLACNSCHSGAQRTNNETMDVETGHFQVPALYEVAYHAPYLHDGRAASLPDVLAVHGHTSALSDAERQDLITYLRSL